MKGGLKLRNPNKKGFEPVMDMVRSRSANMRLVSYNSLQAFMFSLKVDESDAEYDELVGASFSKRVTSYILKFTLLANQEPYLLEKRFYGALEKAKYKAGIDKSTDTPQNFYEEAKLQQNLWKKSIRKGRPAICPPIANLSLFHSADAKALIDFFLHHISFTFDDTQLSLQYILDFLLDSTHCLGILVMPMIQDAITVGELITMVEINYSFNKTVTFGNKQLTEAIACVLSQFLWMVIGLHMMHYDLHSRNALVSFSSTGQLVGCKLIDFGRASDLENHTSDKFLDANKKRLIVTQCQRYQKEFIQGKVLTKDKIHVIAKLMHFVKTLDLVNNKRQFNANEPQINIMYTRFMQSPDIQIKTYNNLQHIMRLEHGEGISNKIVEEMENNGELVNFNRSIKSFYVKFSLQRKDSMMPKWLRKWLPKTHRKSNKKRHFTYKKRYKL